MCLAVPARIVERLSESIARAEVGGIVKEVNLCLIDDVAVCDYVIVHVGFALSRLDTEEAAATLALFAEAGMLAPDDEPEPPA